MYFRKGSLNCITYDMFTRKLKLLLHQAGYSPVLYSGHSMRRGGFYSPFSIRLQPSFNTSIGRLDFRSIFKVLRPFTGTKVHCPTLTLLRLLVIGVVGGIYLVEIKYPNSLVFPYFCCSVYSFSSFFNSRGFSP